jgi:hypothetical protein
MPVNKKITLVEIVKRANKIRKKGEAWTNAIKRATSELKR